MQVFYILNLKIYLWSYNVNRCHEWLLHKLDQRYFAFKRPLSYNKYNNHWPCESFQLLINVTFKLFEWFIFISWICVHLTYFDLVMFDVWLCYFILLFLFQLCTCEWIVYVCVCLCASIPLRWSYCWNLYQIV